MVIGFIDRKRSHLFLFLINNLLFGILGRYGREKWLLLDSQRLKLNLVIVNLFFIRSVPIRFCFKQFKPVWCVRKGDDFVKIDV